MTGLNARTPAVGVGGSEPPRRAVRWAAREERRITGLYPVIDS